MRRRQIINERRDIILYYWARHIADDMPDTEVLIKSTYSKL